MSGTFFIDLDGTIFQHRTNTLLPGARELLDKIVATGGEIVFTTRRGDREFEGHPVYSADGAMEGIRSLKIPYKAVIMDVHSPRIVLNDDGAIGHEHKTNGVWLDDEINQLFTEIENSQ